MSVLCGKNTNDEKELIVSCSCGCDEGLRIRIEKDKINGRDTGYYALMTYQSGHWYKEQGGMFRQLYKKLNKIWHIIRNKDYYYSDICMTKEDFENFRHYVMCVEHWSDEIND